VGREEASVLHASARLRPRWAGATAREGALARTDLSPPECRSGKRRWKRGGRGGRASEGSQVDGFGRQRRANRVLIGIGWAGSWFLDDLRVHGCGLVEERTHRHKDGKECNGRFQARKHVVDLDILLPGHDRMLAPCVSHAGLVEEDPLGQTLFRSAHDLVYRPHCHGPPNLWRRGELRVQWNAAMFRARPRGKCQVGAGKKSIQTKNRVILRYLRNPRTNS